MTWYKVDEVAPPDNGDTIWVDGPEYDEPSPVRFYNGEWDYMVNQHDQLFQERTFSGMAQIVPPPFTHWMFPPKRPEDTQ